MPDLDPELSELLSPHFDARKPAEREGLPPSYRMRADAHYVDQLTARVPETSRTSASTPQQRARDAETTAQTIAAITTIQAAANLASEDGSPLVRRVALDLIRAAAWRAAWQVRAAAVVDQTHRWQFRSRHVGAVLSRVRDGFAADGRLRGVDITMQIADRNAMLDLDEEALVAAVAGAVVATAGVMEGIESPRVGVTARPADDGDLIIEVSQDAVAVDPADAERFFDASRPERLGGRLAAIGAAAVRVVAQRHAGEAAFVSDAGRGSTLRLTLRRSLVQDSLRTTPANSSRNPQA
jgi:light-regulated signal transduction histidine kinase (bacteriophytochrome)